MNTASHILHGLWRDEEGDQLHFNDVDLWIDLGGKLDEGGFDVLFFVDVVGLYSNHKGGWAYHVENGLQIPSNDPSVLISALAVNTKNLGFAITAAPLQEPPFNFATTHSTLIIFRKAELPGISLLAGWRMPIEISDSIKELLMMKGTSGQMSMLMFYINYRKVLGMKEDFYKIKTRICRL